MCLIDSYWLLVFDGYFESKSWALQSILIHGVSWILILIDFLLSAERFYYKATIWQFFYALVYVLWTLIFEAAGWTNRSGDTFIYAESNWSEDFVVPMIVLLVSLLMLGILAALAAFIKNLILIRSGLGRKCKSIGSKPNDKIRHKAVESNTAQKNNKDEEFVQHTPQVSAENNDDIVVNMRLNSTKL